MESLLQNLIQNAIKYTGHQTPVVEIGSDETDDGYRIHVTDNGIGIDPKFHDRIFLVFQRLHTRKEFPGTGIGLALCKKNRGTTRRNDLGRIRTGPGLRVLFHPAEASFRPSGVVTDMASRDNSDEKRKRPMDTFSVLIVEDNPDDFFLIEDILTSSEEATFRVHHEERLENATRFAATHPTDVAIIDLSLPDSVGLDTFRGFHQACPAIPVVIMTGSKDDASALNAVKEGAQDYLFKGEPSTTAIVRTLRYAIERHRLMSQLKDALDQVKILRGMLPICAHCKKIRDDNGYWNQIESYIRDHSEAEFSHSICQDCAKKYYPDYALFDD